MKKINKEEHVEKIFTESIQEIYQSKFVGCSFIDISMKASFIIESVFEDCKFIRSDMDESVLNGSKYENCSFLDLSIESSTIFRTSFIECSFKNVKANNSVIFDSYLRKNNMERTSFCHAKFGFEDTDKKTFPLKNQTDFIENYLLKCNFSESFARGCNFSSNVFEGCNVEAFDLCYATLDYSRFINTIMRLLIRDHTSNEGVESIITNKMTVWKG